MHVTLKIDLKALRVVIRALRFYAMIRSGDSASKEAIKLANSLSKKIPKNDE